MCSSDLMRAMIDLLRTGDEARTSPARLDELGTLVAGFRGEGMAVTVHGAAELPSLPAAVDQAAYRIVQEGLANALRHGADGPVDVTLAHDGGTLRVEVTNDTSADRPPAGTGEPAGSSSGVGLLTMRERAEALGGTFCAGRDGHRWRVRAVIPAEEDP